VFEFARTVMQRFLPRKEVRELGMTLVLDARRKPPSLHLYKALLMAQVRHDTWNPQCNHSNHSNHLKCSTHVKFLDSRMRKLTDLISRPLAHIHVH